MIDGVSPLTHFQARQLTSATETFPKKDVGAPATMGAIETEAALKRQWARRLRL